MQTPQPDAQTGRLNLPMAAEGFREYFGQYGAVTEAQIMQDHTSGRSRGFGSATHSRSVWALLSP